MICIRYKCFINDILYIFENFQIYWKNSGQSEWSPHNSVLSNGKSAILPLFNGFEVLLLHLIKKTCRLESSLRTVILMTKVSLRAFP